MICVLILVFSLTLLSFSVLSSYCVRREMFQLFSIGLVQLTDEGIPVIDALGDVIETYTNKGEFTTIF